MMETTIKNAETTETEYGIDVFSETLRSMQIAGNLLLNEEYSAPWAVSIPNKIELAESLESKKSVHIAAFHLVQRGHIEIELENGDKAIAYAGEMMICFSGMAHTLYQGTSKPALSFKNILKGGNNIFKPSKENYAQSTSLICGIFMLHDTFLNPLFEALPSLLKISIGQGKDYSLSSTASIVNLLLKEINQKSLAHSYMIERYLELLCAKSIRLYIETSPSEETGWLQALKDSTVARAITTIHSQPAYDWSVKKLAQGVALSPSRFAARFTETMRITPMVYVTRWRMYLASKLLNDTQLGIEQVSTRVGYENVAAFSRAFKRYAGSPPGAWRTNSRTL